jgi:hypothetical protein
MAGAMELVGVAHLAATGVGFPLPAHREKDKVKVSLPGPFARPERGSRGPRHGRWLGAPRRVCPGL